MKRLLSIIPLLLALLVGTGCSSIQNRIDADDAAEIKPLVTRVCDRHDDYVQADPELAAQKKGEAIGQSYVFRHAFDDEVDVPRIKSPALDVLRRHDNYVLSDPSMSTTAKRLAIISSENLTRMLEAHSGASPPPTPATRPVEP